MSDRETLDVYGAKAAEYAALVKSEGHDKSLAAFMSVLPAGGRVLDWGCGPGNSAAVMRDAGFAVTTIDASPEFAAEAKRLYDLDVLVETFDALDDEAAFDGIWASFSLLHADRSAMPGHLAQAHRALVPGGRLFLGLKLGEGAQRDGIGRFYTYYTEAEITGLLTDAGFVAETKGTGASKGLDGQMWPWIVLWGTRG